MAYMSLDCVVHVEIWPKRPKLIILTSKFNISEELPNMQIYANELSMYSCADFC